MSTRGMDVSHVRVKIANGQLPAADWDTTHLVTGGSGLGPCAVCSQPTTPANAAVVCDYASVRFYLHPDCYVAWEEARGLES
jgi:hypothetical protein